MYKKTIKKHYPTILASLYANINAFKLKFTTSCTPLESECLTQYVRHLRLCPFLLVLGLIIGFGTESALVQTQIKQQQDITLAVGETRDIIFDALFSGATGYLTGTTVSEVASIMDLDANGQFTFVFSAAVTLRITAKTEGTATIQLLTIDGGNRLNQNFQVTVIPASTAMGGVCDRTPAISDAIVRQVNRMAGVSGETCSTVTSAHLAAITGLSASSKSIAQLQSGNFSGLSGLTLLNLNDNRLTALPADLFTGLSELGSLNLYANRLTPPLLVC